MLRNPFDSVLPIAPVSYTAKHNNYSYNSHTSFHKPQNSECVGSEEWGGISSSAGRHHVQFYWNLGWSESYWVALGTVITLFTVTDPFCWLSSSSSSYAEKLWTRPLIILETAILLWWLCNDNKKLLIELFFHLMDKFENTHFFCLFMAKNFMDIGDKCNESSSMGSSSISIVRFGSFITWAH